jgi:hypothetical protein
VQAAVIENGAESILRDGLAYDRCAVGVVTDLEGAEALADYDVTDSDQMVKVLRTQVDVVLPDGVAVLNADDARVAALASLCDGAGILYAADAQARRAGPPSAGAQGRAQCQGPSGAGQRQQPNRAAGPGPPHGLARRQRRRR